MTRIVLDPDEVNQAQVVTLTDGSTVELATADRATLGRVARQLARYGSVYEDAYRPADTPTAERIAAGELTVAQVAPLYAAVARRHAAQPREQGRGAADVDPTALLDPERWVTGSGRTLRVDELTPSHRRNLLAWLERHDEQLRATFDAATLTPAQRAQVRPARPWVTGTPLHRAVSAHEASTTERDLAMDEARQVARRIRFQATGRWPDG